jgi:hypothetical protein
MAWQPNHDYGREVLAIATDGAAKRGDSALRIDYGAGWQVQLGGFVGDIAIEFDHRAGRLARGAVLDLIYHPYPKKLLALIPADIPNIKITAAKCRNIFERFCPPGSFQVIALAGTGIRPMLEKDAAIIAAALRVLG